MANNWLPYQSFKMQKKEIYYNTGCGDESSLCRAMVDHQRHIGNVHATSPATSKLHVHVTPSFLQFCYYIKT